MAIKNASIIVVCGTNLDRVFMVRDAKSKKYKGQWMFPGGKLNPNEGPWAGAKREFEEETGFKLPHLVGDPTNNNKLWSYIRFHQDGSRTKIYLGYYKAYKRGSLSMPSMEEQYDIGKVKDGETDRAYSVCFDSLFRNEFHSWSSTKYKNQKIIDYVTTSLQVINDSQMATDMGQQFHNILSNASPAMGGCGTARTQKKVVKHKQPSISQYEHKYNNDGRGEQKQNPVVVKKPKRRGIWQCKTCESLGLTPYGVTTGNLTKDGVEAFSCRECQKSRRGGRRRKTKRRRKKRRKKTRKKKRRKRRRTKRR